MSIEDIEINKLVEECLTSYGTYVLEERHIPDYRDGLKPVQRRVLWTMFEEGVKWNGRFTKCSAIVGNTTARYHPHGDTSCYGALVRMTGLSLKDKKHFFGPNYQYPLIEGYGNFGSIDGDPPAAMRYPEARLSSLSEYLFSLNPCLHMVDNYLNSRKEPLFLPSSLPFLLLNGVSGIAVGATTNIPPHNLSEICEALKLCINSDEMPTVKRLSKIIKGPDWSYGGVIWNKNDLPNIYKEGRGSIIWGLDTKVSKAGKKYIIKIVGIPPGFNIEKFANRIKMKKGVRSVLKLDISDKVEIDVIVNSEELMKKIVNIKIPISCNWNVVHRKSERVIAFSHINLGTFLQLWSKYIISTYREFFEKEARKVLAFMKEDLLKVKAIRLIDEIVPLIREDDKEALQELLNADEEEIKTITGMSLGTLSKTSEKNLLNRYKRNKKELKKIKKNLKNVRGFLTNFFEEAKIYSRPRTTKILQFKK